MQSLQLTMEQRSRVVVVRGSGQIINRIHKEIMDFSRRLLNVLGNQGQWNARAIKDKLVQMSDMIEEYHESFEGIWFSGFVWVGQESPLEMIITHKVHTVSKGVGHDLICSTKLLMFYSRYHLLQASMEALVHVVDCINK
jgi:hypothetical protein